MFLDIINTATVPARIEFGRNQEFTNLHIWRLEDKTQTLRVACHLGEFSVWQEGREERELFRINLGILAEIASRAKIAVRTYERSRKKDASQLAPLSEAEVLPIWRACASDPELRFNASLRTSAASLGGWRQCLELAGMLLRMQGRPVPWENAEFVEYDCAA
jgi:hypothetical protein